MAKQAHDDERLVHGDRGEPAGAHAAPDRTADPARASRALDERALTESRELTDDERLEEFRAGFFKEVLPNLPRIPGFHTFWATLTNPRDSIPARLRMGYTFVTHDDVDLAGWHITTSEVGEHAGHIVVNEMVAMKLPLSLYERYMLEAHHHAPQREQDKLRSVIDQIKQQADQDGGKILEYEGMADLKERRRAPSFLMNEVEVG